MRSYFSLGAFFWCFFLSVKVFSQLAPVFIPNGGQWHENVLHKMTVENGEVYMERDGITFAFYDKEFFHHLHAQESPDSVLHVHAIKLVFVGGKVNPSVSVRQQGTAKYSYYLGKDTSNWASNLTGARELVYHEIFPKINLRVFATNKGLKYEFVVMPGGNPRDIKLEVNGADQVSLVRGDLKISTSTRELIDEAPYSYVGEKKMDINSSYVLQDHLISFDVDDGYDKKDTLVVDPQLVFSTYSGSTTNNFGFTATYDDLGFLYSGSSVFGIGYPTTLGAYSVVFSSNPTGGNDLVWDPVNGNVFAGYTNTDIGLSKYDTSGTQLIYSTYLGGELCESPHSIIVNSKDELLVLGTTGSAQFPITNGAYDNTFEGGSKVNLSRGIAVNYVNGSDIFLSKLSADGTQLLGSTYFGGSENDGLNEKLNYNYADQMRGDIGIDQDDKVYIASCTYSSDVANITGAQNINNGGSDGLVAKFDDQLTSLEWGSYVGGEKHDACYSLILDSSNRVIVAGGTASEDLNTTLGVVYPTYQGVPTDGFAAIFSNDGNTIDAMTYYGTPAYDQAYFVRIDDEQSIYLYGQSASMDSTLIINADYYSVKSGMFISKLSNDLSKVIWSTTFGSGNSVINLSPTAFAVDICNNIYLSGWGSSSQGFDLIPNWILDTNGFIGYNGGRGTVGMDVSADAFQSSTNGNDFYLMVLSDDANTLQYATFYGGNLSDEHVDGGTSRFDRKGNIYQSVCAGCGGNDDFPIKPIPGAVSATNNSSCNNGVFKFDFQIPAIVADFVIPEQGCIGASYQFMNTSNVLDSTTYLWFFGDDSVSTLKSPTHQYLQSGTYEVKLILEDPISCNLTDSISRTITLRDDSLILTTQDTSCFGDSLQVVLSGSFPVETTFNWSPGAAVSDSTILTPKINTDSTVNYLLLVTSEPGCEDSILYPILVPEYVLHTSDTIGCVGDTLLNFVHSDSNFVSYQWSSDTSFSDQLNSTISDSGFTYPVELSDTLFYLKVVDVNGCILQDSLKIHPINFVLELSSDSTVCDTTPIWGEVLNYVPQDIDSIIWFPENKVIQGADSISARLLLSEGVNEYRVYAEDTFGCVDLDTLTHELRADSLVFTKTDTSCIGDSLQIALPLVFDDSSKFAWKPGDLFSDPEVYLPKVLTDSSVNLTLVVTQHAGCHDTVLYPIYVPNHDLVLSDGTACFGDTVLVFVRSDPSFVKYYWSSDATFSDQLNLSDADTSFFYAVQKGIVPFFLKVLDENGCEFTQELLLNGVDFSVQTNLDTIVCDSVAVWENILNHDMNALDSVSWSPSSEIILGADSTSALLNLYDYVSDYQVYAVDTNGCADVDTIKIVDNSLNFNLEETTICIGDTVRLGFELSYNPAYSFEWIPNVVFEKDSLSTRALLSDSTYLSLVIDNSFCVDTIHQLISVNKIVLSGDADTVLCNHILPYTASVMGEDTLTYFWSYDPLFSDTLQSGQGMKNWTFVPSEDLTEVFVKAVDDFGCHDAAQVSVRSSFFDLTYPADSTLCLYDTVSLGPKENMNVLDDVTFAWRPSEIIYTDTSSSTVRVYGPNGTWKVTVTSRNQFGCLDSDEITLRFGSLDTALIEAFLDPDTVLNTETSVITIEPQGHQYQIFPDENETVQEGNQFTVLPRESKTYLLTVLDSLYGDCKQLTSVDIEVLRFVCDQPYVYVPNAFTPNGDGKNDVLYVRGKNITKLYFVVFNRWGQKVFETEQQHLGWDGTFKGMAIDPAVYDYYLRYECEGEEKHFKKGNITLIR